MTKKIITYAIVFALLAIALFSVNQWAESNSAVVYEAPKIFTVQPTVKKSDVEQAKEMLAEATAKLDAQEAELNTEIARIKAESDAKVKDLEAKITEINQIRISF